MQQLYYLIIGLFCLILSNNTIAQKTYINKEWANTTGTVGAINRTVSDVDNNKNVIVVSNTVISPNNTDVLITKYDSHGELLWQHTFDGAGNGNDYGVQVKIGSDNAIYIAAALQGMTSIDFGVLKYNSNGTLAWSNTWNNTVDGIDVPADIEVDSNGNIYLVGGSQSLSFFSDYAIVKYNSSGTFQWDATYDHASLHDAATSLKVDVNTVIVTGASASTPTNWDYATLQINAANGVIDNVQRTTVSGVGLDNALAVTTDDDNNIYVTGYVEIDGNKNIQTVKINGDFGLEWVRNFDGGLEDVARSIGVDDFGNVYITGHTEKPNGGSDYITIKYDANGTELWRKEYGSAGGVNTAEAKQLDITSDGEVIITGAVDNEGLKSFATIKYDSEGELKFSKDYDAGSGDNTAESIIVKDNDVFVSGTSTIDGVKQSSTVKYSTVIKPQQIATNSVGQDYIANEVIIRFDESSIIHSSIYKKEFIAGNLIDFVTADVRAEMNQKLGFDCKGLKTFKIYQRMTPADSISISRLGDEVKMDDFWATLSVYFDNDSDAQLAIDSLNTMYPSIRFAERNHVLYPNEIPNDELYFFDQVSLSGNIAGINVEDAWDIETGKPHVKVGVFDTPVFWAHEDFGDGTFVGSKIVGGWDYYANTDIANITNPVSSHGTACAGIIGALRNNNIGIAGIAGGDMQNDDLENTGVQLFSMAISHNDFFAENSVICAAIVEGAANTGSFGYALDIQNHSWSDDGSNTNIRDAVESCWRNHCTFVTSRGNDGNSSISLPASYADDQVLSVIASGNDGQYKHEGNGIENWASSFGGADFTAPGSMDIVSSTLNPDSYPFLFGDCGVGDDNYGCFAGTSAAAPHVTGVAALMQSVHHVNNGAPNNLATEDVEHILQNTATDIVGPSTNINIPDYAEGYDQYNGWGRINARVAIEDVNYPNRYVQHTSTEIAPIVSLDSDEITIGFQTSINGFVPGGYYGKRHLVTWNHIEILPEGKQIIDWWPLRSSTYGGLSNENPNSGITFMDLDANVTIGSNVAVFNVNTYVYYITSTLLGGIEVNQWVPDHPNNLRYTFSLHVENTTVGIEENNFLDNTFSLYPNPTEDLLNISFDLNEASDVELEILDALGKIVAQQNISNLLQGVNTVTINMGNLENGVYFVNLNTQSGVVSKTFVKN